MTNPRFSPSTFLIVFSCAYTFVLAKDWPLFRYYPLHGNLKWGGGSLVGAGPAMAWYGLLCSAIPVALLASISVKERVTQRALGGFIWLFPCAAMLACVFLLRMLFS